jgi:hypothetical protein
LAQYRRAFLGKIVSTQPQSQPQRFVPLQLEVSEQNPNEIGQSGTNLNGEGCEGAPASQQDNSGKRDGNNPGGTCSGTLSPRHFVSPVRDWASFALIALMACSASANAESGIAKVVHGFENRTKPSVTPNPLWIPIQQTPALVHI